jgi:hypothetical protein
MKKFRTASIATVAKTASGAMRAKTNLSNQIKLMLISPVPRAKINRFALAPNQHYNLRYPGPRRGALAIVTNVGAGCGGRGSVGRAGLIAGRLRL